ncbi:MAG: radical SAM protein [Candidatus Odinarchaeia archaeon]
MIPYRGKPNLESDEIIPFMESILHADNQQFKKYLEEAWKIRREKYNLEITFFAPNILEYKMSEFKIKTKNVFQSISITGRKCELMCEHCKGKLLESMHQVYEPDMLINLGKKLVKEGCKGVLISGGSDKSGALPFEKFLPAIKYLNEELKLKIAVHTGLISENTALQLKDAGVESAMIDIIGDESTIKEIYHLNKKPDDFEESLKALVDAGIPVSPHIVVGLKYGEIVGELNAIRVIVAYKPLNRQYEGEKVATPLQIGKIISIVRIINPNKKILLGCARPGGLHKIKTDLLSIRTGVNGIAFPTREAIIFADRIGLKKKFSPYCCSFLER